MAEYFRLSGTGKTNYLSHIWLSEVSMHIAIDVVAGIFLLFAFLSGWYKGFLLSLLSVARVVLAYGAAYFAGRYLGNWIGVAAYRPRIVTIPATAGMAFVTVFFVFHLAMQWIRERHAMKVEEENHRRPFISHLAGAGISLAVGLPSVLLFFWLAELFLVGVANTAIPGLAESHVGRLTQRAVYRVARASVSKEIDEQQADALASSIANPAESMKILGRVLSAYSIENLRNDQWVLTDLLSGNPNIIKKNVAIQRVLADRATLENLRDLGLLSGNETKTGLYEKLAAWGKNDKIRKSFYNLKDRDLLRADKLSLLLRDPDFDVILGEIVKPTPPPAAGSPPPPAGRPSPASTE